MKKALCAVILAAILAGCGSNHVHHDEPGVGEQEVQFGSVIYADGIFGSYGSLGKLPARNWYSTNVCDNDRDGAKLASQVLKRNGEWVTEWDDDGAGDYCGYEEIYAEREPVGHRLKQINAYGVVSYPGKFSCHNTPCP